MVEGVLRLADGWTYDAVSIGYPVLYSRQAGGRAPQSGRGLGRFRFREGVWLPGEGRQRRDDAGAGELLGGKMLFLGLGTGSGSTLIDEGIVEPMELGHLPYKKKTYEDYVGIRGLKRLGKKKWRHAVDDVVARLVAVLEPEYVVLGGGNALGCGSCRASAGWETTPTRSVAAFACGMTRRGDHRATRLAIERTDFRAFHKEGHTMSTPLP